MEKMLASLASVNAAPFCALEFKNSNPVIAKNISSHEMEANSLSFLNNSRHFAWIMEAGEKVIFTNINYSKYSAKFRGHNGNTFNSLLPKHFLNMVLSGSLQENKRSPTFQKILKSPQPDGTEFVYQLNTFPFNGKDGKELQGGEALDITELYHAEESARKNKERLLYLTHLSAEAIWEWDMVTGTIYRNMTLQNMIGFALEKAHDLSWWFNRIHPADRSATKEKIDQVLLHKKQSWEASYRFLCADNNYITIYDKGFVIYENGMPVKMIGSLLDKTETRELEEKLLLQSLQQQKKLTEAIVAAQEKERTNIGHELHDNVNQLLTTAKLFMEMLKPVSGNDIMIVNKTKSIILETINEIRNLSKHLAIPFLKEESLEESIKDLLNEIKATSKYYVYFTSVGIETATIPMERKTALYRIMQEQLKNIVKHSRAKMIAVQLEFTSETIVLSITDDGIGFDTQTKKSGIGLENIRNRVSVFNGELFLESSKGNGCTLRVLLPIAPEEETPHPIN